MTSAEYHQRLGELLQSQPGKLHIALSGGIDSITLMTVAARVRKHPVIALHAVSAAVPELATQRCRELAVKLDWQLNEIDAREFDNNDYVANPVNRCYFCKSSLFDRMLQYDGHAALSELSGTTIATGTNTDDLGDYRPGLIAAQERNVWQPYVEVGIDKKTIRSIAELEGLGALAELPAQPCLSSRVETGIAIDARDLRFIELVETAITSITRVGDIRCRITAEGVAVQLPADSPIFQVEQIKQKASSIVEEHCLAQQRTFIGFQHYKMGSAFLKKTIAIQPDD